MSEKAEKVIFKKDFFNLKENKIFESAMGKNFDVVETLPRVPKPNRPSLVVEEIDVIPNGKILGTIGGSLVLSVPSAPGTLNLVFCWAGPRDVSKEQWAVITLSCLTDVMGSYSETDSNLIFQEITALLNQESFETFGKDEAPVLLNRLNRAYFDLCPSKVDSTKEAADGLMAILLDLTGLESFPDKESRSSFFTSMAGEQVFNLLTVLGNIKQSFDTHINMESGGRRESVTILSENIESLKHLSMDASSPEQFRGFLDYVLIYGLFEGDFKSINSRLKTLDKATEVMVSKITESKSTADDSEISKKELAIIQKRTADILKLVLQKDKEAA